LTSKPSEMETLATLGRNFSNFSPTFTPKYALIVTWYDVGTEHYGYENDFKKNTFQLVITTDGFQSLVIFNIDTIGWSYFEDITNYQAYNDIDGIYAADIAMSTKAGFFKGDGVTCYLHEASNTNKMFYLGDVDPNKLIYRVDEVPVTLTFTTASPSVATTVPTSASTTPESTSATSTTPESTSATSTTPESTSATSTTPESTSATSTTPESTSATSTTPESTSATSTTPESTSATSTTPESTSASITTTESTSTTSTIETTSPTTSPSTSPTTSPSTSTSTLQLTITTTPTAFSTTDTTPATATTTSETTTVSTSTPSGILSTTLTTASQTADRDTNEERIGLIVGLCLAALVIFLVIVVVSCLLCSKKYEACMCTLQCCVQRASPTMDTSEVTSKLVTTPTAPASGPNGPEPVYNNPILPIVLIPMPNAPCPMPNPTLPPEPVMYFTTLPPIEMTER
ncbi:cell wall protein DAN4-like isoform X2, partial [Biomphalaria glabrata]